MSANVETSGFVGRVLGSRWVVGEQLGSGTFGVVHAGIERGTGQPIAVKLLHPQFLHHGETIARFWNEAEALRRMDHPNVLVLLDVGVSDDGVPYLVTELLTGETLRELLDREGALPPERAMRLLGPAAHALHHAHLVGIVHRDLKPENIFRVRKDGMGTTKILDFGVAKLLDTSPGRKLSQTGIMLGTMAYSPPEQMQGLADIDHRADQFGFAALFFEALTGRRPFPQVQPFALFQAVMSSARPRATELRPELPPAVDDVLTRALDPDREQRYASVEEFYLALSYALTSPPVAGLTQTLNGSAPPPFAVPARRVSSAPVASAPPPPTDASARFRAIDEERTRHDIPASDAQLLGTTLQSGSAPSLGAILSTTLVEGSARPPPATSSAPPAAVARPVPGKDVEPPPIAPPPPYVPEPVEPTRVPERPQGAIWVVIAAVFLALVAIGMFVLRR